MTGITEKDVLVLLAGELDEAQAQLEGLGMALISDIHTAKTYVRDLQMLDHVSQRCRSIAAILRSPDVYAATGAANLESIAARLHGADCGAHIVADASSGDVDWNF